MAEHVRVPVVQMYRKSPFEGLLKHSSTIKECLEALQAGIGHYLDGEYEAAEEHFTRVIELEHEADKIKANTRNHLPRFIFMPVDRGDFLLLLREADSVLDYAEDVAVLLKMRRSKMPEHLKGEFRELAAQIVETGIAMEAVVEQLRYLLETSFAERERKRTKELIYRVHEMEYSCDQRQAHITKHLLNDPEMDPITVLHLMKVVDRMGGVADAAENSADRVRVMMAK